MDICLRLASANTMDKTPRARTTHSDSPFGVVPWNCKARAWTSADVAAGHCSQGAGGKRGSGIYVGTQEGGVKRARLVGRPDMYGRVCGSEQDHDQRWARALAGVTATTWSPGLVRHVREHGRSAEGFAAATRRIRAQRPCGTLRGQLIDVRWHPLCGCKSLRRRGQHYHRFGAQRHGSHTHPGLQ